MAFDLDLVLVMVNCISGTSQRYKKSGQGKYSIKYAETSPRIQRLNDGRTLNHLNLIFHSTTYFDYFDKVKQ